MDGIPLAIELAASRVIVLSLEQIEARLRDRFRLLTGVGRSTVARQRTLEATVDWIYDLLSQTERQLLSRMSVFPSSWTIEAAEQICGGDGINQHDVLDLSSRLIEKSLLISDGDFAGARRYRLLETVPIMLPRGSRRPVRRPNFANVISNSFMPSSVACLSSSPAMIRCRLC